MKSQMMTSASVELAHRIEEFEDALVHRSDTDLAWFLPEPHNALYSQVLAELIRVDLEHAWKKNRPRRLDEYRRFPIIFEDRVLLEAVAFEEFRLRRQAGESVTREHYHALYHIDTSHWPSIYSEEEESPADMLGTHRVSDFSPPTACIQVNPIKAMANEDETAVRWTSSARIMPEAGQDFLGFHLIEELGRGAFGRVYLARQGDLAARPVALKVACDIADESQKLAQLQHTNIVPIYSFHRQGPLQAACMPYFGRTTLAHVLEKVSGKAGLPSSGRELRSTLNRRLQETVQTPASSSNEPEQPAMPVVTSSEVPTGGPIDGWTRLEGLSYVEAVLWLGGQIADGLAHAHDRGIVHRDLKPANVLLTDDGRPMLLDFNLAEDTKLRGGVERASIGGTLPYMSPEHMEAFGGTGPRIIDGRSDVFSLGVILFELLTGRHPYPIHKRKIREALPTMVFDRRRESPRLRDR
ncbi:MAG TPA: serine/threonine-protein kinase, partial [Urbifossiella sp.]